MPGKPAARVTDLVAHPLPPVLLPGPGSPTVLIGLLPAWRAVSPAAVPALQTAQKISDTVIQIAENAAKAASGTPAGPGLRIVAETAKGVAGAAMSAAIASAAAGADIHICMKPWPIPPHLVGVDIKGSPTVLVNYFRIGRQDDQILEAIGGTSSIKGGCFNVLVGCAGTTGNVPAGQAACVAAQKGRSPAPGTVYPPGHSKAGQQIPSGTPGQSYNNCGVESARQIINTATGANVSQETLLNQSMASGDADQTPGNLYDSGGTDPSSRQNILANNGVPSSLQPNTPGSLEAAVGGGRGVVVSVWAGNMPNWAGQGINPNDGGHAIVVTGIEYDDDGNPINVIINDTGMGQCSQKIPWNSFNGATRSDRPLNVTNNPIW